jgi:threonine/homoserine/homoserine lactone efflux protein
MGNPSTEAGAIYLALLLVATVIAILWVLLPFAVFGLKDLVRQAIREQKRASDLLHEIREALRERKP